MTTPPSNTDAPEPPRTITYAGVEEKKLPLVCSACGRPADEFAHLVDGRTYARHGRVVCRVDQP